jgi:glycosyltransferase involved in cell wall biosynthesis
LSRFLAKAGTKCSVLTLDLGLTNERKKSLEGVEVIALPCLLKRFYIPRFSYKKIKNVVKRSDVVHLMGHWTFINTITYYIAKRLQKPYVVCSAGALPIYGRSRLLKKIYNWFIGKKIIRNANGFVAITSDEIAHFRSYGVKTEDVRVISNGIDPDEYLVDDTVDFRIKYGLENNRIILFVGRLNHIKGPDLLLRGFCKAKGELKDYHLLFAGPDGGMLEKLKEIVEECSVQDRVHFVGYLGGADKSQAYHASELLVIPSRQEAMSLVVLEAGITGTPVLLTNRCGFEQLSRINGGLVVEASGSGIENGLVLGVWRDWDVGPQGLAGVRKEV